MELNQTGVPQGTFFVPCCFLCTAMPSCIDNCMSGYLMALNIIQKASCRLKFLYSNAKFLNSNKNLLVSALIQSHFDYGCTYWFSALSCKLKAKLQTS